MKNGTADALRERKEALEIGCPFRVDAPEGKILCFDPQRWTLQLPSEGILEEYCRKDPHGCPICQASLDGLREMLLQRFS